MVQSIASESAGSESALSALLATKPVLSPTCITLENKGKILPWLDGEKLFSRMGGGGGGIRTHETVSRLPVFKTGAFDHSATPPLQSSPPAHNAACDREKGEIAACSPGAYDLIPRSVDTCS